MAATTRTITATIQAWLPEHRGPDDIAGTPEAAINALVFHTPIDGDGAYWRAMGYTLVGGAKITVEVQDERAIVDNKVEALRAQKAKVLGNAHAAATALESKIQKLLAIGYAGEVA